MRVGSWVVRARVTGTWRCLHCAPRKRRAVLLRRPRLHVVWLLRALWFAWHSVCLGVRVLELGLRSSSRHAKRRLVALRRRRALPLS